MSVQIDDYLPKYSAEFSEDLSAQNLSMTEANFPTFGTKFTIYMRAKFDEDPSVGNEVLCSMWNATQGNRRFYYRRNNNDRMRLEAVKGGVCSGFICSIYQQNFISSTTLIQDTDWHSFLLHVDCNNATGANRLKQWIDGTLDTPAASSFTWRGNRWNTGVTPGPMMIGGADGTALWFDGKVYNWAFASGVLLATSDFENADGTLKDIRDRTDIDAYLWHGAGDPTEDFKVSTAWTNTGGVTVSSTDIKDDAV